MKALPLEIVGLHKNDRSMTKQKFGPIGDVGIGRCKTCRWWGDENLQWDDDKPEVRDCGCPRVFDEDNPTEPLVEGGAMYGDFGGYSAHFRSTATFGCLCHGKKD